MASTAEKLLTTKEAAEFLGLHFTTLQTWRVTQRYPLPYVEIGTRCVRYRLEDLQTFAAERVRTNGGSR